MRRLLVLLAVLAAGPSSAQSAPYVVPFHSSGNAVELELAAADGADLGGAEVVVAAAPAWLRFGPASAVGDDLPVARIGFDVEREAPVGEPAEVTFEVRVGGAVRATHNVRLEVGPPMEIGMGAPYPNPVRHAVTVPFELPAEAAVRIVAYDVLGREAAVLFDATRAAGAHAVRLDMGAFAAGVYVVRLVVGAEVRGERLTVVR